ncbi:MAG: response regulator [Sedimenticola sp.]
MSSDLQHRLRQLRDNFAEGLPEKIAEIGLLWDELCDGGRSADQAGRLQHIFHKLAGSGGTFGFNHLGHQARALEKHMEPLAAGEPMADAQRENIQKLIEKLPTAAKADSGNEQHQEHAVVTPLALRPIYVVDDDSGQREFIAATLRDQDYSVVLCDSLQQLEEQIVQQPPGAIIMDMGFPEGPLASSELIARIKAEQLLQVPVLFISVHNSVDARLQAVRAGSDAYFSKPLRPKDLVERLGYLVAKGKVEPYKILIVDDDEELAEYHARVLRSVQLVVTVLNQPLNILEVMAEVKPELLLLDLNMPDCTGVELASLLRQHDAYDTLPIVFLSGESDVAKHFEARLVGADDFLVKPIDEQFLIAAVVNRVQRARSVEQHVTRDSMTSLLNHEKLLDELHRALLLAEREVQPLSYCMFDIDHFKRVNDNHGHMVGDAVIKRLAELLRQRLRRTDIIGRYGGEEFGVVMPSTGLDEALSVCNIIRNVFSEIDHYDGLNQFRVTVSGGVALSSDYPVQADLIVAADSALYVSKESGRNRISISQPPDT